MKHGGQIVSPESQKQSSADGARVARIVTRAPDREDKRVRRDTMADREPMIDKLERFLFGASARESVDMRIRLAQQRIEQRIIAALESDDGEGIATDGEPGGA